jgi:N-acetyl-anhydromuramyl-L-alanine amidase AmpD
MTFSLTWLRDVLFNAGLKVAEQPGWQDRGRRDVGQIQGVICHHTAGPLKGNAPSLGVVTNGRPASGSTPALAGPLAQLVLGRDGTYYVVAAGLANHAGPGSWQGITQGNTNFIGIEAENTGLTSGPNNDYPWPAVQMDAYQRGVAAILKKIGAQPIMCIGHKEWAPSRKIDPTFNMDDFRRQVAAIMGNTAPSPASIPQQDPAARRTLRRGMDGNEDAVKQVQQKLNLAQSGVFDADTEAAVRQFQRDHKLVPDGIVGPRTWAIISA